MIMLIYYTILYYVDDVGEWWKIDIKSLYYEFLSTGGGPNISDDF